MAKSRKPMNVKIDHRQSIVDQWKRDNNWPSPERKQEIDNSIHARWTVEKKKYPVRKQPKKFQKFRDAWFGLEMESDMPPTIREFAQMLQTRAQKAKPGRKPSPDVQPRKQLINRLREKGIVKPLEIAACMDASEPLRDDPWFKLWENRLDDPCFSWAKAAKHSLTKNYFRNKICKRL